ncbi:MAG TPA: acyl-ACP--UDP-N-acetylglucosamine O-acyltransferase [Bryobacteraceae bacterium]|nr:acyl-ACP--UDP-N-acetylglucosamine O-acyltransferase [Bryobacteraceae bacterium]
MAIHPTAIVDPSAHIAESAEVGPYCIVGANVEIGAGTRLMAHAYLDGTATIGDNNLIYPYTSIGVASQDLKYKGEPAETRIGNRNTIREFVTIHRGTQGGGLVTEMGDDNLIMAYAHLGHDARIGSHTVIANGVTFAGHVVVGDWAVIGAFSGVHQFCRVGRHAMIGGYSVVTQDVLPFSMTVSPREVKTFGENKTGLERRGFSAETIAELHKVFRLLTKSGLNTRQAVDRISAEVKMGPEVEELLAFIASSERGFVK